MLVTCGKGVLLAARLTEFAVHHLIIILPRRLVRVTLVYAKKLLKAFIFIQLQNLPLLGTYSK